MVFPLFVLVGFLMPMSKWWMPLMANTGMMSRAFPGEVDHGKLWSSLVAMAVLASAFTGQLLPLGHTLALISASFGRAIWSRFLESKTVSMHRTEIETKTHVITEKVERHVDEDGHAVQSTVD